MKRSSLRPIPMGWLIGSALLLSAMAGQAMAAGSISGKLTAPSGYPISLEGTRVNAVDDKFHSYRAEADGSGAYEIADLAPGKYSLAVAARGLETIVVRDIEVKDGAQVQKDFTLETAKPFPVVYSPKPIPLTSDFYSVDFQDAPEIRLDEAWQIRNGSGALEAWSGTAEVSGKIKLKYSDQALHLAADLNFKTPGVNNADRTGNQLWDGNSIEFFWQNDALDLKREEYDLDHDWQVVVTLADPVEWILYQRGQDSRPSQAAAGNIVRTVRSNDTGELVRWDMPFAIFLQNESKKGAISAPPLDSLGALDIVINAADPEAEKSEAKLKNNLSWSGFGEAWRNPSMMKPIKFVAKAN